jgi:hypothetical protein
VSRDEMASALLDVAEGRVPKDRLALKCLLEEMQAWPFLNEDGAAAAAEAKASVSGSSSSSSKGSGEMETVIDEGGLTHCCLLLCFSQIAVVALDAAAPSSYATDASPPSSAAAAAAAVVAPACLCLQPLALPGRTS